MTDVELWPEPTPTAGRDEAGHVPTGDNDTPVPRAQLAAEAVWWDAVAAEAKARGAQAREQLDAQARGEFTRDGIAPTWRIPGVGTVPLALTADRVDVVDEAAYTAWVFEHRPDEVETITRVRPAYDKHVREGAAKRGAACTADGEVIPGLRFTPGGEAKGIAIRASSDAKDGAAQLATAALDGLFELRFAPPPVVTVDEALAYVRGSDQ